MLTFYQIHKARISVEEMRSGVESSEPKELPFRDALQEAKTRTIYIRRTVTPIVESACI